MFIPLEILVLASSHVTLIDFMPLLFFWYFVLSRSVWLEVFVVQLQINYSLMKHISFSMYTKSRNL